MPPPSPKVPTKRQSNDARQESRGMTASRLNVLREDNTIAVVSAKRQRLSTERRASVIKIFDKMLAGYKKRGIPLKIGGVAVNSWEEATSPTMQQWSREFVESFFKLYLRTAKPANQGSIVHKTIHIWSFKHFTIHFFSAYRAARGGLGFDKNAKIGINHDWSKLAEEFKLRKAPYIRPLISSRTVVALAKLPPKLPSKRPKLILLRRPLYLSIAANTGCRSGSIIGNRPMRFWTPEEIELRSGTKLGDIHLWAKQSKSGGENDIYAYLTPRWGKSKATRGPSWPLVPTPQLCTSPAYLILVGVALVGALGEASLKHVLDPAFLNGEAARPIRILASHSNMALFPGSVSRPLENCQSATINKSLKTASREVGVSFDVITTNIRHLCGQRVYERWGYEKAQSAMTHAQGSRATRHYVGHCLGYNVVAVIFGSTPDDDDDAFTNRIAAASDPNAKLPAKLPPDEIAKVLEDPTLLNLKLQQSTILTDISESFPDITAAPTDIRVKYAKLGKMYSSRLAQLLEKSFRAFRELRINSLIDSVPQKQPAEAVKEGEEEILIDIIELELIIRTVSDDEDGATIDKTAASTASEQRYEAIMAGPNSGMMELYELLADLEEEEGSENESVLGSSDGEAPEEGEDEEEEEETGEAL